MPIPPPDHFTLFYPAEIAGVIGLSKNSIASLKQNGCRFVGKKTTVQWVRDFIAKSAGTTAAPIPATAICAACHKILSESDAEFNARLNAAEPFAAQLRKRVSSPMKTAYSTIAEAYTNSYNQIATRQSKRYNNPIGEAEPADASRALAGLVDSDDITLEIAKKIARNLGKAQYGEMGHSHGRVCQAIEKVIPSPVPLHIQNAILSACSR